MPAQLDLAQANTTWDYPTLDLDHYRSLTDLQEIQEALRLLDQEENRVDGDLDALLADKESLEGKMEGLDVLRPRLGNLKKDALRMVSIVSGTSHLAERISDKVRQLDLEQSRVKESMKQVEDVQELKYCITGLQQALQARDDETAAAFVHRASKLEQRVIEGSFAEITVPNSMNPDHPAKTLADAKQHLYRVFAEQFDVAATARHEAEITRYFKLFPLIGCQAEGLDKYSRFVCGIVRGKCQEAMGQVVPNPTFYVTLLSSLFEHVAVIVDKHTPLVQTHYGPGKMLRVIQRLQEESDLQSGLILDGFMEDRQIARKIGEIQSLPAPSSRQATSSAMQRTGSSSFGKPATPLSSMTGTTSATSILESSPLTDPRELAVNCEEMAMISQQSYMFHRFLDVRAKDEMEVLVAEGEDGQVWEGKLRTLYDDNGLLRVSGLARRVHGVMDAYLIMEECFLRKSIDKAMKIDEYDEKAGPTSSCVDDVFYILKRTVHRAMRAADPNCLAAAVTAAARALENDYLGVFQRRMMTTFAGHEGRGSTMGVGEAKVQYMVILNNLDVSADYIQKLTFEVQQDVAQSIFVPLSDADKERALASLAPLASTASKFKQLLQTGIEQLFGQTLKPGLRPLFHESYKDVKYVLDEEEYSEADVNDVFTKRFRARFDGMVEGYKKTLTENNFSKVMALVVESVAKQWEKIILQTKFNQLGALCFDKDLRALGHYLSNMTEWPSRDRFTRLNQMVTLLSFEAPDEIYDYWGNKAGPVTWRLTVTEVKKVLALRMDFAPDDVANLKL